MSIQLTWNLNSIGSSQRLYRSTTIFNQGSLPSVLATLSAEANSFLDETDLPGIQYYYMLETLLGSDSVFSSLYGITALGDTTPAVVTAGAPTDITDTSANLPWSSDKIGDGFYLVDQNVTRTAAQVQAGTAVAVTTVGAQTPIAVTGLTAETTYYAHFVVVIGGVSSTVSTSVLTTTAVPIVGDPLFDQTMVLLNFDGNITDESALGQTFTAFGGAAVSGGALVLDGNGDGLTSDARPDDFTFLTSGAPFTIEWRSTRGTASLNTVFNTNAGGTANVGLYIGERSNGGLFVLMTKGVGGSPTISWELPAGTIPVGAAHKVIECNFGAHTSTSNVIRLGIDSNYISFGNRTSVGFIQPTNRAPEIGFISPDIIEYQGSISDLRATHSLRYDLFNNSTYTVPPEPMLTVQQPGFQMFTPQHYPLNDRDDGFVNGVNGLMGYRAEPDLIQLSTPGHALSIFHVGSSHNGNSDTVLATSKTTNYGRTWSPVTTLLSDPSFSIRSPSSFRASNGRIFTTYNVQNASNVQQRIGMIYSDDDGATWSSEVDLTTGVFGVGPDWVTFGLEETSQGLMVTVYSFGGADCEVAFTPVTGTPSFTAPVTVYTGQTQKNEPFPIVCDDLGDQVVLIVRSDTGGNRAFYSYKSSDGGLTWANSGSADWTSSDKLAAGPVGAARLSDGRIIAAWNERDTRKRQYYSIMDDAAFFADPSKLWDRLGSNPNVAYHECWATSSTSNFGYPSIWDLGGGNIIISHYEGVDVSSTTTRLYNVPLQV